MIAFTKILQNRNRNAIKAVVNTFGLVRNDIVKKHCKWYQEALESAASVKTEKRKPCNCSKMTLKENYPSDSTSALCKRSLAIPFVDVY